MIVRAPVSDQMALTFNSSPPDNTSSSFVLSLCPTATTLFILPSTYTLLFLTALPGNALSLWVFQRCITSISPTHVYLSHLSVSNLMSSLTMPFLAAYYARGSAWPLSSALCQLVLHVITPNYLINMYISLIILTLVALNRFASLIKHTHASRPSTCTTLLPNRFFTCLTRTAFAHRVCVAMWVVAVGGIVPVTVYYSVKETTADAEKGVGSGGEGVCYSPAVELGGALSAVLNAPLILLFFVFYLLVLLCYMTVLRHIRRSRRSTNIPTSHSQLGRVLRNIVVIQVVLSVCLLPYHIFKPVFIYLAHDQPMLTFSTRPDTCHPLSTIVELKSFLIFLAELRGATDPLMYFLLDKMFRSQTLRLFRCNKPDSGSRHVHCSITGSVSQNT
ncbi:probable G-protein coupled receptor 82 [Labrus bergylta]|uniref:probable G-protein coupled receptor 82 n=1 Tax=Labrus bergylta TaxID=56723 RepID=UPI003313D101